jgi:hypothetical protein
LTNFNEFYGDLWASITFPRQECHNYEKSLGAITKKKHIKGSRCLHFSHDMKSFEI